MKRLEKPVCKVMIIDDDPLHCEIARSFFEKTGATLIVIANDGNQAVKKLEQYADQMDLLMVDLNMPDFDGVELLGYLQDTNCDIPVLIVSGTTKSVFVASESLAKQYGLFFLGALEKPLNYSQLEKILLPCR